MTRPESALAFPAGLEVGMELRDWFAGKALSGFMASDDYINAINSVAESREMNFIDVAATAAYEFADAMMKAREK